MVAARAEATRSPIELDALAWYLAPTEPDRAVALLERARALDPGNEAAWEERIAQVRALPDTLDVRGRAPMERAVGRALPRNGMELSPEDARDLERRLADEPGDHHARTLLVEAYQSRALMATARGRPDAAELTRLACDHAARLIEHAPGSPQAGEVTAAILRRVHVQGYQDLVSLWEVQVAAHAGEARVLGNAARFHAFENERRALELLERARELEPDEPEWSRRIADLRERRRGRGSDRPELPEDRG